jgi:hypothetical protein
LPVNTSHDLGSLQYLWANDLGASVFSTSPLLLGMDGFILLLIPADSALDRVCLVCRFRIEPLFNGLQSDSL